MFRDILERAFSFFESRGADYSIRWNDSWEEIDEIQGPRWTFIKETEHGIKLRKASAELYRNMETGEYMVVERRDSDIEWHNKTDRVEWPEQVEKAINQGDVWWSELGNPENKIPEFRGMLMSTSGAPLWYKRPDARIPEQYRND